MEFLEAASNSFPIAAKKPSDVADTAVPQFGGFDGGVNPLIAFAQRMKDLLHGPFDVERIEDKHGGILPVLPALLCGRRKLP